MTIHTVPEQDMKKLGELIADIKVAMFTTVDKAGRLHCRPMATVQQDFKGDLWFFTKESSFRTEEIKHDPRVQLSYVSPSGHTYATLSGHGEVSQDRQKMAELWNPLYKAWFPKGLEEPDIALIKVSVQEAEYWDTPSNTVVKLLGFIKALATGKPAEDTGHHLVIAPKSVEDPPRAPPPEVQAKHDVARWIGEGGNTVPQDNKKPADAPKAEAKPDVKDEAKKSKSDAKSEIKPVTAKSDDVKTDAVKTDAVKADEPKPEHHAHEAKPPRNPIVAAAEKEKKSHKGHRKHA